MEDDDISEGAHLQAHQASIDPLVGHVTHVELRSTIQILDQAVKGQVNRLEVAFTYGKGDGIEDIVAPVHPKVNSATSKVWDFSRMKPLKFHGSKMEDERFIVEVHRVLFVVVVSY